MRFIIRDEEQVEKDTVTAYAIETDSNHRRKNKRLLKELVGALGIPVPHRKRVLKEMRLWETKDVEIKRV